MKAMTTLVAMMMVAGIASATEHGKKDAAAPAAPAAAPAEAAKTAEAPKADAKPAKKAHTKKGAEKTEEHKAAH